MPTPSLMMLAQRLESVEDRLRELERVRLTVARGITVLWAVLLPVLVAVILKYVLK